MGTDIHGVFQRRDKATGEWADVPHNYSMDRHYQLFAVLAGVRNGIGFAGVPTGEVVTPISAPRGYPEDFEVGAVVEDHHPISSLDVIDPGRREWAEPNQQSIWMGDHSHSWLTADEMLGWWEGAPTVTKVGILSRKEYEAWDKVSRPDSYCGGVGGHGVVIVNDNEVERQETPGWTYIRCHWQSKLAEELAYFFDEVRRLRGEHGEVRFVFGFDS